MGVVRLVANLVKSTLATGLWALLLVSPAWSAAPTVASSHVTRGTLTYGSDAIVFKSGKQEQRFPCDAKHSFKGLAIPGLKVLDFQFREIVSPGSKVKKSAAVLTFECRDGSKLGLVLNDPVEVARVETTYSDGTKTVLWKQAAEIQ